MKEKKLKREGETWDHLVDVGGYRIVSADNLESGKLGLRPDPDPPDGDSPSKNWVEEWPSPQLVQ